MPAKKSSKKSRPRKSKSADVKKHSIMVANKMKNTAERHLKDTITSCKENVRKAQRQFDEAVERVKDAKYVNQASPKARKSSKKLGSKGKRSTAKSVKKSPSRKKRTR